jgi:branched-chain amino acid transport system substrate-binding protein
VDGYFWVVGGTGTGAALKAYEQAYGKLKPEQNIGNLFFGFLGADKVVAPKVVGSYVGGFGNMPGVHNKKVDAYRKYIKRLYPTMPADDGFFYNYYMAAKALVEGLQKSKGALGARLQAAMPRSTVGPFQISNGGKVKLDSRRQAIQDQYQLQLVKNKDGSVSPVVVAYVPSVDQSFGGLFKPSSPPPGRTQPACKKLKTPWQGKMKVVKNGKVTNTTLK